jgi:hypothetical protein
MYDFFIKLLSISIVLSDIFLVGYSCVRAGNYIASQKRNAGKSSGNNYKRSFYLIAVVQAIVFVWFIYSLPQSHSQFYNMVGARESLAAYVVIFFFAISIAHSLSETGFDPQPENWQLSLETQLRYAFGDDDQIRVNKLVLQSLRRILSNEYGDNHYRILTRDFFDIEEGKKPANENDLFLAFKQGWDLSNTNKFIHAQISVVDCSLPLLIDLRRQDYELLRSLDQRFNSSEK